MAVYRSKVNWWPPAVAIFILIGCTVLPVLDGAWLVIFVNVPVILLLLYSYLSTAYIIDNGILIVKSGFYRKKIPVSSLRKITETTNIVTAPALSFKRLELFYNGYNSVEISPKNKEAFIAHLQKINPAIVYQPKAEK